MKDPSPIALGLKWWQAKRGRKGDDDDDEHEHEHEHDWEIGRLGGSERGDGITLLNSSIVLVIVLVLVLDL
jgi:hypothetical protein